jgi:hypothetical protein
MTETTAAIGRPADYLAEAVGATNSTAPTVTCAAVAPSVQSCYCEQADIDPEGHGHGTPCAAADPYIAALSRWLGLSNSDLDSLLRDL